MPKQRTSAISARSIGQHLGGAIGSWAGRGIKSLFGSGDYHTEHEASGLDIEDNSIVKPMTASQVPLFSGGPEHLHGAIRVQHREYIADVPTGEALGNLVGLRISPNNSQMFPWLYSISRNFEQWLPMGIVFEFVSTAGNAFSGGAANLGDVNMATLYDVAAEPLNSKSEILNHFYSTSGPTSQNLMHAIECAPGDTPCTPRYITHPNASTVTADPRLNEMGILYILTQGSQSIYTAGQLWVTYDIVLLKPRLGTAIPGKPKYYTAYEIIQIQDAALEAGRPLTRDQMDYLYSKVGERVHEDDDLIEDALQQLTPLEEEEKTPNTGWLLS